MLRQGGAIVSVRYRKGIHALLATDHPKPEDAALIGAGQWRTFPWRNELARASEVKFRRKAIHGPPCKRVDR